MGQVANWGSVVLVLGLSGCTSALHGTFVASSFRHGGDDAVPLGLVEGRSCQTQALYFLPMDEPPSTREAMEAATLARPGTRFLVDVSIDDETLWHIGYARECIVVEAIAWGIPAD